VITAVLQILTLAENSSAQEEPSKEGGMHPGADSSWGKTNWRGGSF